MAVDIIFITHSTSEDNEAGIASGWADSPLSPLGEEQALRVRARWEDERIDAVYASDLTRQRRTAEVAFAGRVPVHVDARLREVDYGALTQHPRAAIDAQRVARVHHPHPEGESYAQAVERHRALLDDIASEHEGGTALLVGSYASWMAMEHLCRGRELEEVAAEHREWQPCWRSTYGG